MREGPRHGQGLSPRQLWLSMLVLLGLMYADQKELYTASPYGVVALLLVGAVWTALAKGEAERRAKAKKGDKAGKGQGAYD